MNNPTVFPAPFQHIPTHQDPQSPEALTEGMETASSYSTFSITSSQQTAILREDDGRFYQTVNDEYGLPAADWPDENECLRLDLQHYAFKATQRGSNYLAPVQEILGDTGEGKTVLDVGTGTGIWSIEMASEFPQAQFLGVDIAPVQRIQFPSNVSFDFHDCTRALPYEDGSFDLVHSRMLAAGVRNWKRYVEELVRVTKKGGMTLFVETDLPPIVADSEDGGRTEVPAYSKWCDYLGIAIETRGLSGSAGSQEVPHVLESLSSIGVVRDVNTIYAPFPLTAWSQGKQPPVIPRNALQNFAERLEPHLLRAGSFGKKDLEHFIDAARLIIIDGSDISPSAYSELASKVLKELDERSELHFACPTYTSWALKN